jgi:hypothetical protein
MPRGGARPGAGRPKGRLGRRRLRPEELHLVRISPLERLLARISPLERLLARISPLERLLARIEDQTLDAKYRDQLCIAVLPFMHAKPAITLTAKCSFEMSSDELDMIILKEEAYRHGELGTVVRFPGRRR